MADAPPSLPSAAATVTTVHVSRLSQAEAVELPTASATQQFYKPRARTGSNTRSRSVSVTSTSTTQRPLAIQPHEPTSPRSFASPPPTATHTGSILPPASFFRPSKPGHPQQPRPISVLSSSSSVPNSIAPSQAQPPHETIDLKPVSLKQSREPLLPMGEKARRPPDSSPLAGGVRGSLERIFKRTPSTEQPQTILLTQDEEMSDFSPSTPVKAETNRRSEPPSPNHVLVQRSTAAHPTFAVPVPVSSPPAPTNKMSANSSSRERNYQHHPSRNTFFCNGHFLSGAVSRDQPPIAFIVLLLIVFSIAGIWFGTTCVWWWYNESPAVAGIGAYLCLITVSSLLATALRDPGILPRDLDPDPPYPPTTSSPSEGSPRNPLPRDIKWRTAAVRVKYCTTCKTYRAPRSSHCKLCDNCVDNCDHHCQWVNNCVGRRNYSTFITFLVASTITLLLIIATSILHIYYVASRNSLSVKDALSNAAGSAVVFSESILVLGPLLALLGYHIRLLFLNVSTIEQIRAQAHASLVPGPPPTNPFTLQRWYRNVAYLLCRPAGYSWIEPSGYVELDKRLPNPGWKSVADDVEGGARQWGSH